MVNPGPAVFLFVGSDSYSKEEAIKRLKLSVLDSSSRELDYKVFDGADAEACDILDYISTIPFLASKRLVVIKNFEKLPPEDNARLIAYIKNPAKSTCLILDAEGDSVIKEYPQISRHVILKRFGGLTDSQFQSWAKEILSSMGEAKEIAPDAVKTLKELYGDDLGSISQELQKLSSFVGERRRIDVSDVEEIAGRNLNASAFDLTDAIGANDLKKALSIISELIMLGKKHYEIVGLLCWQMKRLFKGRMLMERGVAEAQIANMLKIGRRYQDAFFGSLKASSLAQIELKMSVLLETDLDIKKSRFDPALALEFAVIKLCLGT